MKKFMTRLLGASVLAAAFLLAACGAKKDPAAIYDEAIKKQSELSSVDMTLDMKVAMAQGEQTIDIAGNMAMKMDGINTDKMHYSNDTTMSAMGQDIEMSTFYTDGYLYTDMQGQKIKYAMDLDTMMKQAQSATGNFVQSSAMKEIKAEKDGDNQKLTYTVDPAKMDEYTKSILSSMGSSLGDVSSMDIKIIEGSGTMTVNKGGYPVDQTIKMKMEMEMPGADTAITMDMDMSVAVINPGQAVTVEIPDTEGYTEVEMPSAGA